MGDIGNTILATAISVVVTLAATMIFNKLVGLPKAINKQKEEARLEKERQKQEIADLRIQQEQRLSELHEQYEQQLGSLIARLTPLEASVAALPSYRQQSLDIQGQLRAADSAILEACEAIKAGVQENQNILNARLDRLEHREKNSLRQKLLQEYRLFTDPAKNPMGAWSEMEHHSFFELVKDYEDLGGNDFVHSVVLPSVNKLTVIQMSDTEALYKLMQSRTLGC